MIWEHGRTPSKLEFFLRILTVITTRSAAAKYLPDLISLILTINSTSLSYIIKHQFMVGLEKHCFCLKQHPSYVKSVIYNNIQCVIDLLSVSLCQTWPFSDIHKIFFFLKINTQPLAWVDMGFSLVPCWCVADSYHPRQECLPGPNRTSESNESLIENPGKKELWFFQSGWKVRGCKLSRLYNHLLIVKRKPICMSHQKEIPVR